MASMNNGHVTANGIQQQQQKLKQAQKSEALAKSNGGAATMSANNYVLAEVRNDNELQMLAEYAVDYAHSIGLVSRSSEEKYKHTNEMSVAPPLALLPSAFPRELYEQAIDVQQSLNELYFRVSCDHEFLMEAYKEVIKGDPFHAKLVEVEKRIQKEGIKQPLMLGLQRADYLSHWNETARKMELKQVEVNPGQIGGPGSATGMSKLHRKMLEKVEILHGKKLPMLAKAVVPENRPRDEIAMTIYQAWKMFGDPNAMILLVNQPDLFPVCHFEQLQFLMFAVEKLAKQDGNYVLIKRLSFIELRDRLNLDEAGDYSLYLDGTKRIALVHMAYGYLPEHYHENDLDTRIMMERSKAIVSPTLRLQLAGTKKIQQVLSEPGVLERFFPNDPQQVAKIRVTFTELWGLSEHDAITEAVVQDAMKNNKNYVMKSQMDGGHGIYFDDEITKTLKKLTAEERGAFILMKKIKPVVAKNFTVRPFEPPQQEEVNSELGIYGSLIGDQSTRQVLVNTVNGYLVRSKAASRNLGGISSGGSVLDSVMLFPSSEFH
uniref:Glutathione synthetase n=1 Tax=Globodera pallida TaxID=36090 RepID=A0A183CD48_GLOPA